LTGKKTGEKKMHFSPRVVLAVVIAMMLSGCCSTCGQNRYEEEYGDAPQYVENEYEPAKGRVFHVASFDIVEGETIREVFDEFEEPMHAPYYNNNVVKWTYYVDYDGSSDDGRIVRYCELDNYPPHSLCKMTVEFYKTYVTNAYSTCR